MVKYLRDTMGVGLAGGQGKLKGKIVRIGHMGFIDEYDILAALSALEMGLNRFGYRVEYGSAHRAALPILNELYPQPVGA